MSELSKAGPESDHASASPSQADVLVVGGGIGGSTVAAILGQAGLRVSLIDPMQVHAQHVAAALTPVISRDDNVRARLTRLGATLAARFWGQLDPAVASPCGALQLQRPEGAKRVVDLKAQADAFDQPDWARWVEPDEASVYAGLPLASGGIWFAGGWLVRVPQLLGALQSAPQVTVLRSAVSALQQTSGGWLAQDDQGQSIAQGSTVVLANAFDVLGLLARSGLTDVLTDCDRLPAMHRIAGEVTLLPAQTVGGGPRCIVGGDGYVLPEVDGWCVSGGTYARDAEQAVCSQAGRLTNLKRAQQLLGSCVQAPTDLSSLPGWAGWRAVLPGRLPAIGRLPNRDGHCSDLWVMTAGASRGLTWSVMGATLISDQIQGRESVVDQSLAHAIRP